MNIIKIAAFSDGDTGGNPAGVLISEVHPDESKMQEIAAAIGFPETAFACPLSITDRAGGYRVRYFAPACEVDFCGHATIALGAALAAETGVGIFKLVLNHDTISVEGFEHGGVYSAALQSPETKSEEPAHGLLQSTLELVGYGTDDLDLTIPPVVAYAGEHHLVVPVRTRERLRSLTYQLEDGRKLMSEHDLCTIMFVHKESPRLFHARNAFAIGGVLEDPATGAASAAFAGYLRDSGQLNDGVIDIVQGEDMGFKSLIRAEFQPQPGSSIRISGSTRNI